MKIKMTIISTLLGLTVGIAFGYAIRGTDQVETQVIPAASLKDFSRRALEDFCGYSAVFSDLVRPYTVKDGVREEKVMRGLQMIANPLSDRAAVCSVKASIITRRTQQNGNGMEMSEDIHLTYLVAINGDSEIISEEFAKELLRSHVIGVVASNLGNDGTIVPKVKLKL
ncbi:MAG: hypothetical protein ACNJA3_28725 (plasmid) [Pseudomonas rhizophila]|uniref:hypothetical protein n=1 Tax=Pseudomonas rhizophila TaxID=2045200 RepID=UPI003F6ACC7C